MAKKEKTAPSAGRGSGTGSGAGKMHGKTVLAHRGDRPPGTPQQGKCRENRKKMLNRRNEPKDLLKTKGVGYFRGQKRTYFLLRKAPNEAKNEANRPKNNANKAKIDANRAKFAAGTRETGNADLGQYRACSADA